MIDSGSDITIMGAELFAKAACLHKQDLKKPDKIPRTYDQRTFSLDGQLDLDIGFGGKCIYTPVYVWEGGHRPTPFTTRDYLIPSRG